jgi:hypothetical protein
MQMYKTECAFNQMQVITDKFRQQATTNALVSKNIYQPATPSKTTRTTQGQDSSVRISLLIHPSSCHF